MISVGYIAGFIDGEGCFSAHYVQKASPSVTIVNTNLDILNIIADFAENISGTKPNPRSKYKPKRYSSARTCYTLRLGPPILRILLPLLIPELHIKRYQAECMLELINLIPSVKGPHNQGKATETYAKRQELVDKITWANQGYR